MMNHNASASSPKPLDASSFVSILDSENIELFNRDCLNDPNQGWLWFMEQKRRQYYEMRRRWTRGLIYMFAFCFIFALLFLLLAMRSGDEADLIIIDNDHGTQTYFTNLPTEIVFSSPNPIPQSCSAVKPQSRIDCNPDPPISSQVCLSRGCCWLPAADDEQRSRTDENKNVSSHALPPIGVPYCFFGLDYRGYNISKAVEIFSGRTIAQMRRTRPSGFARDINVIRLQIDELTDSMVRIRLVDRFARRYEVPIPKLNLPELSTDQQNSNSKHSKRYRVTIDYDNSILAVYQTATGKAIFSVNLARLIFSDQFIQITNDLPVNFIYGIGENRESFYKKADWKRYTLFARDQWPVPDKALYGSHPFYLTTDSIDHFDSNSSSSSSWHGVFLFNSNALDIVTQPHPSITYRTIGGILDFFIFLGSSPEDVIAQYHRLIGLPAMPAFWTLGFHLSRFGYQNLTTLEATYQRTKAAAIPYDVQWTDIDMFDSNNDFTYDRNRFAKLPAFVERLHAEGMRFVPMFDCGISAGEQAEYAPYRDGLQMNVFVRNASNQLFVGKVWNTKATVWPDFTHPNATDYWTQQFAAYHRVIAFDGAWIDMNEPSNFLDGAASVGCPVNRSLSMLENPQYTPGMTDDSLTLRHKTLCMSAQQFAGRHYDLHNLYGLSEAIVTNRALKSVLKRRPFILSRSTAPGHGHFAAHWDGDIISDWPSMKWSISSILNFNMFGIPLVGADICGFNGNTTVELCARWHQLGAFYSFARNHNTDDAIDQDPAALGPQVITAARTALKARYAHLAYLYTLLHRAHRNGGTVLRPLFFEFPADRKSYTIDTQFMWGSAMMIAPALHSGDQSISVYFPPGVWFHAINYTRLESEGKYYDQMASFNYPNFYYRAGSVIPAQQPLDTTDRTRAGNFSLFIILDRADGDAIGSLYWDSGDGLDADEAGTYNFYEFKMQKYNFIIESRHLGYETEQTFNDINILGLNKIPNEILVNGIIANWSFSAKSHVLHIHSLALPLFNNNVIVASPLSSSRKQTESIRYRVEVKM